MALWEGFLITMRLVGRDVFLFPLWWYTEGVVVVLERFLFALRRYRARLGISVWIKNLFVPMYGQRDWQGRIMSFVMRLVQIFARSLAYGVYFALLTLLFCGHLLFPLLCIVGALYFLPL